MSLLRTLALLPLVWLAIGCGPPALKLVPVSGVVTLDGKPVAEATVMFSPEAGGVPAVGLTDAAGRFQLTTNGKEGALVGTHQVMVTKMEMTGVEADADGLSTPLSSNVQQIWHVPKKYSSTKTSGLTEEVKAEMPEVELKLTQ